MAALTLIVVSVLSSVVLGERYDVKLTQVYFDGSFMFFPVKREKLQQRLDEINTQFDNNVRIYKTSLPDLHGMISSDEHVIIVGFGNMTATTFNKALTDEEKESVSTNLAVFGTMIPVLASEERGNAEVTFQDTLFISGEKHIKVNVLTPFGENADKLVRIKDGEKNEIRFEKDNLLFEATEEQQGSCEQIYKYGIDGVKEFERERSISRTGPDFSICDRFPNIDVDFCNVYRDPFYSQVLKEAGNNVCLYLTPTSDVQNCESKFHVTAISQQMRDLLMIDDETNVLGAAIQKGTFDMSIVFPCIQ